MTRPPLWVVRGEVPNVFLFGQGPWGVREGDLWFTDLARQLFSTSAEYWHEVPDDPRLTDGELLARFGLSANPLSTLLDDEGRAKVAGAAESVGVDVSSLDGCRPWLAGQILDNALRSRAEGPLVDVEGVLTEDARQQGKRVKAEFADAEAVLSTFASLGEAEIEYLLWTADRVVQGARELRRQAEAWLSGEVGVFEEDVGGIRRQWPCLYERLLLVRNTAWTSRLEAMLAARSESFVVMGMSHLVGDEGVVNLVRQSGYEIERAQ